MTHRLVLLIVLGAAVTVAAQAPLPSTSATPAHLEAVADLSPDPTLIQRFLAHRVEPVTHYRASRRLEAENQRFNVKGWMEVVTELTPDGTFTWRVVEEGGSGYIRNRVLRKTLEGEAEALRDHGPAKAAIDESNYVFALERTAAADGGEAVHDDGLPSIDGISPAALTRLFITPKRKDMMLVDGMLVLARADADLVQIQGRLAKSPSFWTRSVDIVRRYARIGGIRVPIVTESTANVRVAGRSEFRMTYTYQMINGRNVVATTDAMTQ